MYTFKYNLTSKCIFKHQVALKSKSCPNYCTVKTKSSNQFRSLIINSTQREIYIKSVFTEALQHVILQNLGTWTDQQLQIPLICV